MSPRLGIAALLSVIALGGCGISEPDGPGMVGSIVARDRTASIGGPPSMHVKTNPNDACGVVFLVRSHTSIFRREADGRLVSASESMLTVGREVTVWTELVLDSCPGQARADAVEIR
jgi:hypothetical protein